MRLASSGLLVQASVKVNSYVAYPDSAIFIGLEVMFMEDPPCSLVDDISVSQESIEDLYDFIADFL